VAVGVTVDGERDIVGLWAGQGAKYWLQVLTEIKNRGVEDVCIVVCDGLTGLPDAIGATWPRAITQTCVLHLLRNSFRYASKKYWPQIARDLKPIYTAPTAEAAWERLAEFAAAWEDRYPAIIRLWENAWAEFVPFLTFPVEIRTILYSTDEIVNLGGLGFPRNRGGLLIVDGASHGLGLGCDLVAPSVSAVGEAGVTRPGPVGPGVPDRPGRRGPVRRRRVGASRSCCDAGGGCRRR
jgi:Transposase, Mutator family